VKHGHPTIDILLKRERLLVQCAVQRDELAALTREFQGPLQVGDRAVAAARYLREHPLVLGAVVAMLAVVQRRGLWKWASRGFMAWRAWRTLKRTDLKSVF
jgi:hypothetical protein